MKHSSVLLSLLKQRLPSFVLTLAFLAMGLMPARSQQLTDPLEITEFWFDWMVNPPTPGPRVYVKTEREILQTGPNSASFQSGSSMFVLADGSVGRVWRDQIIPFFEEWDTDRDGWRDVVENDADPPSNPFDPFSTPVGVAPDVYWTTLAIGIQLPVSLEGSSPASVVRTFAAPNVRLDVKPAGAQLPVPLPFYEYSTQFYITNTNTSSPQLFGLSLYSYKEDYPNPSDVDAMEQEVLPGAYRVVYPTINNPYIFGGGWVNHYLVPNGSFTLGLKKPSWLVRTAEAFERLDRAPVPMPWVNGRLRFDPNIATIFKWDDIVRNNLASPVSDLITVWIEDETETKIWPPIGGGSVLGVGNPQVTLTMPGILPAASPGNPVPPSSVNGFMILRYSRNFLTANSGDLSTVTLRIPVELIRGYASWRKDLFPGALGLDDSVSGPTADPDGDGLTNQEEFEAGSDPNKPTIGVFNPISQDITSTTATLGATVELDPFSGLTATVFERGIVYSQSAINPFPTLDGSGVTRLQSSPAGLGDYTVNVTGLTSNTSYSFSGYAITSLGTYYTTPVSNFSTLTAPPVTLPTVTSPTSSALTGTTATLGGNVTSNGNSAITEVGVVYSVTSVNDNPFIGGTGVTRRAGTTPGTGVFTVSTTGLTPATTYSFRAYAINAVGTSHTTAIGTFTTPTLPTITSPTATNIAATTATLGGNVTGSGGIAVLQRGVVFSITSANPNPLIGGTGVNTFLASSAGLGIFTVNVTALQPATQYSYKAFVINSVGTAYTSVATFTTAATLPTIASPTISNVTAVSALVGANVTATGSSAILERGFVYSATSTNSNPVVDGPGVTKVTVAGTTGAMSTTIAGLTQNTSYTFKAFARNAVGTAYAAPIAFFTTLPPLTVNNPTVANVTTTTATLGGTVVSDSGTTATARGVVYSTNSVTPPAVGGPGVTNATASGTMGPFTVNVAGLTPGTQYFFRAYATNASGTSYSAVAGFTTLPLVLPGDSVVEWIAAPGNEQIPSGDGPAPQTTAQPPRVPQFVYVKDEIELSDPLVYAVEVSEDSANWQTADPQIWDVEDTGDTIKATWISTDDAPSRMFFRVRASTP